MERDTVYSTGVSATGVMTNLHKSWKILKLKGDTSTSIKKGNSASIIPHYPLAAPY